MEINFKYVKAHELEIFLMKNIITLFNVLLKYVNVVLKHMHLVIETQN